MRLRWITRWWRDGEKWRWSAEVDGRRVAEGWCRTEERAQLVSRRAAKRAVRAARSIPAGS